LVQFYNNSGTNIGLIILITQLALAELFMSQLLKITQVFYEIPIKKSRKKAPVLKKK
jgi:hypothetical protein